MQESIQSVLDDFDAYVDGLRAELDAGSAAGTVGDRDSREADRLVDDYRGRIAQSESGAEAQRLFGAFKREVRRLAG